MHSVALWLLVTQQYAIYGDAIKTTPKTGHRLQMTQVRQTGVR